MEEALAIGGIVAVLAAIGGFFWYQAMARKKRIQAFENFGAGRGLTLRIDRDFELPQRYPSLDYFQSNSGISITGHLVKEERYAYNVLSGEVHGLPVLIGDYDEIRSYRVTETDSEGKQTTRTKRHKDRSSFFLVEFKDRFDCEMTIRPEGWLDKVAGAVGFKEVEVGNEAFDKAWVVKASKPQAALDLLTADMQLHLNSHRAFKPSIEFDASQMLISRGDRRFKLEELNTVYHLSEGIVARFLGVKSSEAKGLAEDFSAEESGFDDPTEDHV